MAQTGSGKTLTSYKVARNLSKDLKSFDKSIFIVDRVDLDQQTTSSFQAYAANDTVEIDETDNVKHLIQRLKSKDTSVIVTTIQKLNYVISRYIDKGADTAKRHDKETAKEEEKREREGQKLRQLKSPLLLMNAIGRYRRRKSESWRAFLSAPFGTVLQAPLFLRKMHEQLRGIWHGRRNSFMAPACISIPSKKLFMIRRYWASK